MLYRVNFLSHLGTLEVVNTLHAYSTEAYTITPTPTAQQLAEELEINLATLYRAMLATTYTLDSIDVQTVPDPNDPAQVPTAGSSGVSLLGTRTVANSNLPNRIGGLLSWNTGFTARYARGRMFTPPVEVDSAFTSDLLSASSSYVVACNAFADAVLAANAETPGAPWSGNWTTWGLKFYVYSRSRHRAGQNPNLFEITGYTNARRAAYLSSRDS